MSSPPPVRLIEPNPPDSGGWIKRMWPFIRAHRGNVIIAFTVSIIGVGLGQGLAPVVEKIIVDRVVTHHRGSLALLLTALLGLGVVNFVSGFFRRYIGGRVSLDVQYDLRNAIYERLQRLDLGSHDQLRTGQLVSRSNSDVGLLQGLLAILPISAGNAVLLVISFVVMLCLSPLLTLVGLVAIPLMLVIAVRLRAKVFPATWHAQQKAGEVAEVVDEAVSGVRVVKGFGQDDREIADLSEKAEELYRSRARLVRVQARYSPALQSIPSFAQGGVIALGGYLTIRHQITIGTFLAFSSYMGMLMAPVRFMAGLMAIGQQARAGAERVLDLLDSTPRIVDPDDPVVLTEVRGEVVFDDASFGYLRSEPVLDHFDLRMAPGERVALVGSSGSGKSTVALLLPRFYDVQSGSVTIDGHDVRTLGLDSLRHQVGVVFEESFLFSDTIRANIAYGRPDATDAEVEAAARAAAAHDFIVGLPDGYDTRVGERGLTLSGGQRQRVALARVLVTDPKILLLDDATSSVDTATEEEIQQALTVLMEGRTTLLVAHRRSTLRLADRIAVVDGGRIVAQGSHDELLASSALYRALLAGPGDALADDPTLDDAVDPVPVTTAATNGNGAAPTASLVARTDSAWQAVETERTEYVATPRAGARGPGGGGGGGGRGPGGGSFGMSLAATPELLAQLETLPAADDEHHLDLAAEAMDDGGSSFNLRRFVQMFKWALGLGFVLVAVDSIVELAGPFIIREGIDRGISSGRVHIVLVLAVVFVAVTFLDWFLTWAYTWQTGRTAERMLLALRVRIFAHLQRMGVDYYDREMGGRIMTRMTTDPDNLSDLLQTGLIQAIVSILTFGGVLVVLAFMSPRLMLAVCTLLPPLAWATWEFRRRSSRAYDRAREHIAAVNADLQESLSGVRVAQAHVREGRNAESFRGISGKYLDARLDAQRLVSMYFPFVAFVGAAADVIVLEVGSHMVRTGALSTGVLIAFLLYLDEFFSPIQQLSQVFDTYQQAAVSMKRVTELMATPTSTPPPVHPLPVPEPFEGRIRFEGVRFAYAEGAPEALQGVDLEIFPGEVVALVGETGAGKSTIVKLVARFHDPTAGRVLVDGVELRELDLTRFRHRLGYVPQEPFLFSGTIRDNIAYGRPDATDAEVEGAARAVGAHPFIAGLAGGYLHEITERGRSLSSGQRQLVCLARAHVVDPTILLLDEATANLDLATEARVAAAMQVVSHGRTTLVVAHRLQTAQAADRVILLADGQVAEQGTHDELLALGGRYAQLWNVLAA